MEGGVLLIGYEMYRALASGIKLPKLKGRKGKMLLEEKRNISRGMLTFYLQHWLLLKKRTIPNQGKSAATILYY